MIPFVSLMRPRPLGKTGLTVSPLALGTVKFGRTQGLKYPASFELPSDSACRQLLDLAAERGVNTIDTAPAYGSSEDRLGRLLKGQRERWVVCSKAGEEFVDGVSLFDFSPETVVRSLERSLRRLGTDRVDVLLLHSDGKVELELEQRGLVDALNDVQRRGLARAVGVSVKSLAGAMACVERFGVVMVTLNRRDRSCEPAIERAQDRGVGVLVKKALASGHEPEALSFALGHAGVSSVVVGTIDPAHLAANCDVADAADRPDTGAATPIP